MSSKTRKKENPSEEAETLIALSNQEANEQFKADYAKENTGGVLGIIPGEHFTGTKVVGDVSPSWNRGIVNPRTAAHRVKVCEGRIVNAFNSIHFVLPVDEVIEVDPLVAEHLGAKFIRR